MKWSDAGGGNFEQAPIGSHVARCIRVIDIGTQKSEYQGQVNIRRQVIIVWELPDEKMTEGDHAGKPFIVSKFYTASLSEKANLRKDLANWRGRDFTNEELSGFDSKNILGKPCMVSIIHNEQSKARVAGVMAMPKGIAVPDQINPSVYFSLDEFDHSVFDGLSDGIKKLIEASPEYVNIKQDGKHTNGADDPFGDFEDDLVF
ncbi:MAG: hypothetical protein LBE24_04185 [Methylobacillus sp.]|jgi:hypothetical protein|nr:hypothetical protein [Methylobacillus sp.]